MGQRVSQDVVEAEIVATPKARVSQQAVEAEIVANPRLRISQEVVEAAVLPNAQLRVSQMIVEVLLFHIEVPMPIIYPQLPTLGYSVMWTPKFFNMPTQEMSTGAQIDLGLAAEPLHDFELTYEMLRDSFQPGTNEFKTMLGFFGVQRGQLNRFAFPNPDDRAVQQQPIGTTDGTTHVFDLVRTFGVGEYSWTEHVGYVDMTLPFNVYLDGVLQSATTYNVLQTTPMLQQIAFTATPATGHKLTVDMSYYYWCKLPDDTLGFEKFMNRLWNLKKIKIHSCRAGA